MDLRSKITLMALADITPYENNPRNNEEAVEKVANSIKEFGFNQPIVVDKDNVIIVGHTRYLAAQELGLTEAPVIVAGNLSDEQARAYRLADNKTGELAGWDFEKLALELEQIEDIDMGDFGFESHDKAIFEGSGRTTHLEAPLINLNKAGVVKLGLELNAPYQFTWSCYEGGEKPCGTCGTCIDRAMAFEANGVKDPALED